MMDILPYLARLSKVFQNVNIDFSKVKPMVDSTCESLNDLIECEGVFVDKLSCAVVEENGTVLYKSPVSDSSATSVKQNIQNNVEFQGFSDDEDETDIGQDKIHVNEVELSYYSQQKNMLSSVSERYINQIVSNLRDRFEDVGLINDMRVIVPSNIVSDTSKVAKSGKSEIRSLASHFSFQHSELQIIFTVVSVFTKENFNPFSNLISPFSIGTHEIQ